MVMKRTFIILSVLAGHAAAYAQTGTPWIHDPSTIAECDGKYYTFGTGGGGLISEDGWHWHSGAVRPGGGAAPDVLKIGDRYLVAYSATGGGLGGSHKGRVLTMWNKTLDPASPDFKFTEPVEVASSADDEDCDAIDAGLLLDPETGRLWLSYGTYFGFIRLVELDPETGARKKGNEPKDIAIDCEATDLIYRDGWYYLLGTHGTCCDGVNSTYNIVVGRSRQVTGPYLDNVGRDMLQGGGRMVIAASERLSGPGHFGRTVIEEGVEKMSCHFEADFDLGGRSTLGIRPLLWNNGWPKAGELFQDGNYEIESERRGYSLELSVDFVRLNQQRAAFWNMDPDEKVVPIAQQTLDEVKDTWSDGDLQIRMGDYMARPHQKWTITAVPDAGGYLGGPYFRIQISGTERTLTAMADGSVIATPYYNSSDGQLWRIDQLTDGTYRIMPKMQHFDSSDLKGSVVLTSAGDCTPTLATFDFNSDNSKWNLKKL